jgi:hypothetical protein
MFEHQASFIAGKSEVWINPRPGPAQIDAWFYWWVKAVRRNLELNVEQRWGETFYDFICRFKNVLVREYPDEYNASVNSVCRYLLLHPFAVNKAIRTDIRPESIHQMFEDVRRVN